MDEHGLYAVPIPRNILRRLNFGNIV